MLYLGWSSRTMKFSERYTASLDYISVHFTHSKIFQTKCLNNWMDRLCYLTVDPLVMVLWGGLNVIIVVPQIIFNLGSWLAFSAYYSFADLDHWMVTNLGMEREPSTPPVNEPRIEEHKNIRTRAQQYAEEARRAENVHKG